MTHIEDELYENIKERFRSGNFTAAEYLKTIHFLLDYAELLKTGRIPVKVQKKVEGVAGGEVPVNVMRALKGANTK